MAPPDHSFGHAASEQGTSFWRHARCGGDAANNLNKDLFRGVMQMTQATLQLCCSLTGPCTFVFLQGGRPSDIIRLESAVKVMAKHMSKCYIIHFPGKQVIIPAEKLGILGLRPVARR